MVDFYDMNDNMDIYNKFNIYNEIIKLVVNIHGPLQKVKVKKSKYK